MFLHGENFGRVSVSGRLMMGQDSQTGQVIDQIEGFTDEGPVDIG
jgi:hypothetical protein